MMPKMVNFLLDCLIHTSRNMPDTDSLPPKNTEASDQGRFDALAERWLDLEELCCCGKVLEIHSGDLTVSTNFGN